MEEWISFLGALAGVVLGSMGTYLTLHFNYKQLYAETVSQNRMDWINVWRENVSVFLACAEILHKHSKPSDKLIEVEQEMYKARGMIVSRLNLSESNHVAMLALINNFTLQTTDEDFKYQKESVLAVARKILKPEWERVKKEAKGRKI
jgi:hypothetical protein